MTDCYCTTAATCRNHGGYRQPHEWVGWIVWLALTTGPFIWLAVAR